MRSAEVEVQAAPRYCFTKRGVAIVAAMAGLLCGAFCAVAAMHAQSQAKDEWVQARLRATSEEMKKLRREMSAYAATVSQLEAAKADVARLSGVVNQLAQANALALQEADAMPAFKTAAYREPFDRMTALLRTAAAAGHPPDLKPLPAQLVLPASPRTEP